MVDSFRVETVQEHKPSIRYWRPNSLPPEMLKDAHQFINRRFKQVWGIDRIDITKTAIYSRENISLMEGLRIIGWLGIEADGELDNGCIEKGRRGVRDLQNLIEYAAELKQSSSRKLYALVPLQKLGSALACLRAGMKVAEPVHLTSRTYPNRSKTPVTVHLIKLVFPPAKAGEMALSRQDIDKQLEIINRIRENFLKRVQAQGV